MFEFARKWTRVALAPAVVAAALVAGEPAFAQKTWPTRRVASATH